MTKKYNYVLCCPRPRKVYTNGKGDGTSEPGAPRAMVFSTLSSTDPTLILQAGPTEARHCIPSERVLSLSYTDCNN